MQNDSAQSDTRSDPGQAKRRSWFGRRDPGDRPDRPWIAWHWKGVVAALCAIGLAVMSYFWIWLPNRPVDISHTQYVIKTGDKFTHRQIDDAIGVMLDRKWTNWHGCVIDKVTYDEAWSDRYLASEHQMTIDNPGYGSSFSAAIDKYGADRVAIFQTDFQCKGGGDTMSMGTSRQTGWMDTYVYDPASPDAKRGWVYIDSGY